MRIMVAGAGAGKTTQMAKNVLEYYQQMPKKKIVYVITYTNNSRDSIRKKIIKIYGFVPTNLYIETIHVFLYREIIKPYHHLLFEVKYKKLSLAFLGLNDQYKNKQISDLKEKGILHIDKVTETAKWIVDKKSTDKKQDKEKRNIILKVLQRNIGAVFVDEAQDMDKHMQQVFKSLNSSGIYLHLIGDPKQNLKGINSFKELVSEYPNDIEYIVQNYRCPQNHLDLSNKFVAKKEEQKSSEKKIGSILYAFESDVGEDFFNQRKWDHVYIYQRKNGRYETSDKTRGVDGEERFKIEFIELLKKYRDINDEEQCKKYAWYMNKIIMNSYIDKGLKSYIQAICKILNVSKIETSEYAVFAEIFKYIKSEREQKNSAVKKVISIEKVKGLEGENCLFILSSALYPYFSKEKTTKNKVSNHLYVALTRSSKNLVILLTREVEEKFGRENVMGKLEEYNIPKYSDLSL